MKCFPDNLKHSEVTQARKKKGKSAISDIYIKKNF